MVPTVLDAAALLAWLATALRPGRLWDLRPIAEEQPVAAVPTAWPFVCVLVHARNESARLTLPAGPAGAGDAPPGRGTSLLLVAWGYDETGQRVLLDVVLGQRERFEDCLEMGRGLVRRGLRAPMLVVTDGAPGLIRAIEELWPDSHRQRCTVHYADVEIVPTLSQVPIRTR